MTTSLYKMTPGATQAPLASDVNQIIDMLTGANDVGTITLAPQLSAPSISGVTAADAAGANLGIGAYLYKLTYVSGYKKTDRATTIIYGGETNGSASISVSTTSGNQSVTLSNLPTSWPSTAVATRIYRTAVGGSDGTQKLVTTLNAPQASYTDTLADASLGAAIPTANMTGTKIEGASEFNQYATNPDTYDIYQTVQYKRKDGTLYMQSTLSNPDVNGNYQTATVNYYAANGTTVVNTITWTISYDSYGKITSKVMS